MHSQRSTAPRTIDGHYVVEHGALRYVAAPVSVRGWYPAEAEGYVERLRDVVA